MWKSRPSTDGLTIPDPGDGPGGNVSFARYHSFMLVSRVDDRFGNWVRYNYSGNNLSRIESSDGRVISLQYNNNRVSSATAHGKTWSYNYNSNALTRVNRPDGSHWQFAHSQASFYDQAPNTEGRCLNNDSRAIPHHLVTITHPTGAVGDFKVKSVRHGRTEVPKLQLGPVNDHNYRYAFAIDRCYNTIALTEKTISGSGLDTMTWQYSYSENEGAFVNEPKQAVTVIGGGLPSGMVAGDLKFTRVKAPDNSVTVHYFNRRFDWREGSEVFTDYFDTDGTTRLRRILKSFAKGASFGSATKQYSNADLTSHAVLTTRQQVIENGDTFTTDYSAFNVYSTPTLVKESNNLNNQSRWQRTTFYHDTTHWLLNLPAKLEYSSNNSQWTTVEETSYYSSQHNYKSLPYQRRSFGSLISTFNSYHNDGNLMRHSYNISNRWVQFEQYKRGQAQLIKLPQRYTASCGNPATCFISASRVVNDDGTIAQVTDFNGNRTSYQYDGLRRLTRITPADSRWAPTILSYPMEGGQQTQHISQGNYRKKTTFDALLRPVLAHEWDATVSNSQRYTVQRFNAYNHPVFISYPSSSNFESNGMLYEYDGLQRLTSELSTLSYKGNSYYYLSGNQIRTENARGLNTYTRYQAWGRPAYELPVRIENNDSTTTLSYNLFGNLSVITQGGITETRLYNGQQRLCRVVRPDIGHTAYGYNMIGEVVWSAAGASGGASACNEGSVTVAQRVTHSYDNLGELRSISYPDSTPSKVYVLDNQGNLTRLTAGTAVWNYAYNSKSLLETETLSFDGRTFSLGWGYNNLGHVSSVSYPGGRNVSFNPNALGQARQAGSFATGVSYYPGGQLNQFTFGNSIIRKHTLDSQKRLQNIRDYHGSTNFINFTYGYDDNHNVTSITDSLAPNYNLTLRYDDSDRLEVANGQWGSGSIRYDTVGNITRKTLGSSTLNYNYTNNRLTGISGSQSRSFGYDTRGNITHNGVRSLSFNLANQLTSSGNLSYVYDGHNRMIKRTSGSGSSYQVYSLGGQLMHEQAADGSRTDYIYLAGKLIAKAKGSNPSYVHSDALGSPRLETNASRVIQSNSRQHYQPFGQRIPGSTYTDIGFTGHKHDGELGLTYMQQRYYDPLIGRFYSNDPVGFTPSNPMMFNRYAYANNNPYKFVDPDGKEPFNFQWMSQVQNPARALFSSRQEAQFNQAASNINNAIVAAGPHDPAGVLLGSVGLASGVAASLTGVGTAPGAMVTLLSLDGIRSSWTGGRTLTGMALESGAIQLGMSQSQIDSAGRLGDFAQGTWSGGAQSLNSVAKNAGNVGDAAAATSQIRYVANIADGIQTYSVSGRIDSAKLAESLEKKD
ncbi:RHS repeat-associated core domain-containing protein [Alkalimonas sp.]|uniref:RHS repeat-associated core domain-containing protein n=1 Tax=Alkalimonas sp. TaxID=1872453 RepID=UPI00263BA748|nr:RHS repeat-associated core domain-containing protein [Alkalimonas sp.]MCC5827153.1 hypothetical protein [Alkalimonas sp.]